MNPTPCLW